MTGPRLVMAPYALAFASPLATSRGLWRVRRGVGLALVEASGALLGLGEAAPLPAWGTEPEAAAEAVLRALAAGPLPPLPAEDAGLDPWLDALGPLGPASRAGVELAACDALARARGEGCFGTPGAPVALNALVSATAPEAAAAEARRLVATGYRTLKLKIGSERAAEDAERVRAVREAVGPDVALRLDANGAFATVEAAAEALAPLAPQAIAYVEEPLAAPSPESLGRLASATGLRLALDETLAALASPESALAWPGVAVYVLKPAALGYRRARRFAELARAAGREVVFTSALDGGVASLGAARLAAALAPGRAHGLATVLGFERPWAALAAGIEAGAWRLPAGAGLGLARAPWEAEADAAA